MKQLLTSILIILSSTITNGQYIIRIAGTHIMESGADGQLALNTTLYAPLSICRDKMGNIYIGESGSNSKSDGRIRKIDVNTSIVTTIAGGLDLPASADSLDNVPATNARIIQPYGLCLDKSGNLFFVDRHTRIRKVNLATGIITTIAGSLDALFAGDGGPATLAKFINATDIALDAVDDIYVLADNRIRKIDAYSGIITTIAGIGVPGFSGDGGPAISAQFAGAYSFCFDSHDNIYVADWGNHRIRKISVSEGYTIKTIAGSGIAGGFSGDGEAATDALLKSPGWIACDNYDNIYFKDEANNRIRKIDASTNIITTIAGNGSYTWIDTMGNNGLAINAYLLSTDMCFDTCDNMYMGSRSRSIRAIVPTLPVLSSICGYNITAVQDILPTSQSVLTLQPNPSFGTFTLHPTDNIIHAINITVTSA